MEDARFLFGLMLISMFGSLKPVDCAGIQCLSNSGDPVDWFIVYKLPDHPIPTNNTFYYMDTVTPSWQYQYTTMDQPGHAVYKTLNQIYSLTGSKAPRSDKGEVLYAMYNDARNFSTAEQDMSTSRGHTKGVLAFDVDSGFWMVHSTPNFPYPRTQGYQWRSSENDNGQTFLCISMATSQNLDKIGWQLLYNYPTIYDNSSTPYFEQKFPNMTAAMNGHRMISPPCNSEITLTSLAGTVFTSFAKCRKFNKDLYKDWLAPWFQDSLYVETWQSGEGHKLCSNCTGQYWVYNVDSVAFSSPHVEFKETNDHSKWAITENQRWTCIGDINRMRSQETRGGGAVCFQHPEVWSSFQRIIKSISSCPKARLGTNY